MSLTSNFSVSQDLGNLSILIITDTSTGSDNSITSRRVYFEKADGTFLKKIGTTTDYEVWSIGDTNTSFPILDKDYALDITVQWFAGASKIYEKTILNLFKANGENRLYQLTQYQISNPAIVNNPTYYRNKIKLRTLIDDADQAVVLANDQTSAQQCMDLARNLTLKELRLR